MVNWITVRTLLALSHIHKLHSRSIDFVLAFPQAKLDTPVYMELPFGFQSDDRGRKVLRLKRSLYGLKQASNNWFEHLIQGLDQRNFVPSTIDPCLWYNEDTILLIYVDDVIIFSRHNNSIDNLIDSLQNGPEKYVLTDEGDINKYLGVDIFQHNDNTFELRQPFLIDRCLKSMQLKLESNPKKTPVTKPLLHKDINGDSRKFDWNYRQVIGMLNYLQSSTRPDISMATHQCARFCQDPKALHERAVRHIGKYLLGTKTRGIKFTPDSSKGIECYVDADFAGNWHKADSDNPENVLSRTGYVIYYGGCPVFWCSKLQTEIALSTAEAEYIALSQAMRDVIPLMQLTTELSTIINIHDPDPIVKCKVFEDNESCISIANSGKFSPRTRHIAIKYHHFRQYVKKGIIKIFPIDTKEQTADIFTKPLPAELFQYLRQKLCGW